MAVLQPLSVVQEMLQSLSIWYIIALTVTMVLIYASVKSFWKGHPDVVPFDPREVGERAGVVSVQGQRAHMEDTYHASPRLDNKDSWSFYGVFDGHGGDRASAYVAKHLVYELIRQIKTFVSRPERLPPIFPESRGIPETCYVLDEELMSTRADDRVSSTDQSNLFNRIKHFFSHHLPAYTFTNAPHNAWENLIFCALSQAYKESDRSFLRLAHANSWQDGTTAVACLILPSPPVDKKLVYGNSREDAGEMSIDDGKEFEANFADTYIFVANTGDSRGILVTSDGGVIPMSDDHKPNRADERRRIEGCGGRVVHFGTWRVEGVLAVARAFGDRHLKKFVIPDPEIRCRKLQASRDLFLILASDGVWDVLSNEDAAQLAITVWQSNTYAKSNLKTKLQAIAGRITTAAYQNGSMDNITTLVVHLPSHIVEKAPPYVDPSDFAPPVSTLDASTTVGDPDDLSSTSSSEVASADSTSSSSSSSSSSAAGVPAPVSDSNGVQS